MHQWYLAMKFLLGVIYGGSRVLFYLRKSTVVFLIIKGPILSNYLGMGWPKKFFDESAVEDRDKLTDLNGEYLWYDGRRENWPEYFNSSYHFMHPAKLSPILSPTENTFIAMKNSFCRRYIVSYFTALGRAA